MNNLSKEIAVSTLAVLFGAAGVNQADNGRGMDSSSQKNVIPQSELLKRQGEGWVMPGRISGDVTEVGSEKAQEKKKEFKPGEVVLVVLKETSFYAQIVEPPLGFIAPNPNDSLIKYYDAEKGNVISLAGPAILESLEVPVQFWINDEKERISGEIVEIKLDKGQVSEVEISWIDRDENGNLVKKQEWISPEKIPSLFNRNEENRLVVNKERLIVNKEMSLLREIYLPVLSGQTLEFAMTDKGWLDTGGNLETTTRYFFQALLEAQRDYTLDLFREIDLQSVGEVTLNYQEDQTNSDLGHYNLGIKGTILNLNDWFDLNIARSYLEISSLRLQNKNDFDKEMGKIAQEDLLWLKNASDKGLLPVISHKENEMAWMQTRRFVMLARLFRFLEGYRIKEINFQLIDSNTDKGGLYVDSQQMIYIFSAPGMPNDASTEVHEFFHGVDFGESSLLFSSQMQGEDKWDKDGSYIEQFAQDATNYFLRGERLRQEIENDPKMAETYAFLQTKVFKGAEFYIDGITIQTVEDIMKKCDCKPLFSPNQPIQKLSPIKDTDEGKLGP